MNYRTRFDHLGNPVYPAKPDWQHRVIRWVSGVAIVACLGIMAWGR